MEDTQTGPTAFAPGLGANGDDALRGAASAAHEAVDAAARKAQPTIDRVAAMAHQAVDSAAGAAAPAVDFLAAQGESLQAARKQLVEEARTYVAENPLKSVAIAVAAGFVLSRIALR